MSIRYIIYNPPLCEFATCPFLCPPYSSESDALDIPLSQRTHSFFLSHAHASAHTQPDSHSHIVIHIHTYSLSRSRSLTHTHMQAHTHTHTHTQRTLSL